MVKDIKLALALYGANDEYWDVNIWPRPVQQPHPPIYTGRGPPRR